MADDNIKFVTANFILFRKYSILTNINFNAIFNWADDRWPYVFMIIKVLVIMIIMLALYANNANHFLGIIWSIDNLKWGSK